MKELDITINSLGKKHESRAYINNVNDAMLENHRVSQNKQNAYCLSLSYQIFTIN